MNVGAAPHDHWDFAGKTLFSDGERLGVVEGASMVYRPELSRGLPSVGSIEAAGGVWPGGAWVAVVTIEKDGGVSRVFRFHGDGWVEEPAARRRLTHTWGIAAGPKGSGLLLRGRDIGGRRQAYEPDYFQVVGAAPGAPVIRRDSPGVFGPIFLRTREDGSIVVLGKSLPDLEEPKTPVLALWGPRDTKSRHVELPDSVYGDVSDVCVVPPAETIIVGSVSTWNVWTYDGASWTVQAAPEGTEAEACAIDGSVFAIVGDHVEQRLPKAARWQRIDLPAATPPFVPDELWAGASGALWVSAKGGGRGGFTLLYAPLPVLARPTGGMGVLPIVTGTP